MLQDNIRNIRKDRGLTQEELAIRLNVVRQTVSKWEKGLSVPDADMLQKLADILEVIYALAEVGGHSKEELHSTCAKKREARGGFEKRIFLISK